MPDIKHLAWQPQETVKGVMNLTEACGGSALAFFCLHVMLEVKATRSGLGQGRGLLLQQLLRCFLVFLYSSRA